MSERSDIAGVVVGVGLSSAATHDEVAALVRHTLEQHGLHFPPAEIATRSVFVDDPRLQLGCAVVGVDDDLLVAHTRPVHRTVGLPARVAQTAAALIAHVPTEQITTERSAHVTVAIAVTSSASTEQPA